MKHFNFKKKLMAIIIAGFAAIVPISAQEFFSLPAASQFYDFDGTGEKGFLSSIKTGGKQQFNLYNRISDGYSIRNSVFECDDNSFESARFFSAEDVNKDGKLDFSFVNIPIGNGSHYGLAPDRVLISKPDNTYSELNGLLLPNADLNLDGRIDLIEYNYDYSAGVSLYQYTQQPNGNFVRSIMQRMSQTEYNASLDQEEYEAYLQALQAGYRPPKTRFSGVWLGPSIPAAFNTKHPTEIFDMNGDGNPDLFFAEAGIVLFGTEKPDCFVQNKFGNNVKARDLNGDGFTDYVIWDNDAQQLKSLVYRGEGEYETTILMSDIPADKTIYCYDFDRDGDVDILATFSYPANKVGSFTLFAQNDGNGNFTTTEGGSVTDKLLFAACRDIDGDGYYDLLAFDVNANNGTFSSLGSFPIKIMYGQAGGNFKAVETLFMANTNPVGTSDYTTSWENVNISLNIEDLDNDGKLEIWLTDAGNIQFNDLYSPTTATANTAPTAPAAPSVNFNAATGRLDIYWTAATDAQTSACDLTYEVRIGSASGKGDVLFAHANADGTRRNFADGNASNNLHKVMDASTWQSGTYYIAVQAIDPQHAASAWSVEAVFENTALSSKFTTDKSSLAFCDTLKLYYTPLSEGYTLHWELNGATELSSSIPGELHLQWANAGLKTISLQIEAPDGTRGEILEKQISIMPNKIEATEVSRENLGMKEAIYEGWLADWNMNGKQDAFFYNYDDYSRSNITGIFANDGTGNFNKISQIAYLTFAPKVAKWVDWDMDGVVDLLYGEGDDAPYKYGFAKNNINNFAGKSPITFNTGDIVRNGNSLDNFLYMADLDNDGDLDPISLQWWYNESGNQTNGFMKNDRNGNFSIAYEMPNELRTIVGFGENLYSGDWNKDGLLDLCTFDFDNSILENMTKLSIYYGIQLLENKGDYNFENKTIPFETSISNIVPIIADMDNDGYLDVIYIDNEKRIQILHNESNKRFVKGNAFVINDTKLSFVINNTIISIVTQSKMQINGDWDNNGYLDVLVDVQIDGQQWGVYVFYNDGNGNYRQGLLSDMRSDSPILSSKAQLVADTDGDGVPNILLGTQYLNDVSTLFFDKHVTSATNTAPQAPTGIIATQTENALIIEWDAAHDAETPAAQMRYNLSVKKKGATGANAYIISPLNGGNSEMAPLPSPKGGLQSGGYDINASKYYLYPTATRFEIPLSALSEGEVEISLQAIDLWDAASPFSEIVTKKIESTASFKMPANACFNESVEITYSGVLGGTPEWDFDGGQIVSGSGFGPYQVKWNSEGVKTITLTNGSNTATAQIKVLPDFSAEFDLSDNVFYQTEVEIGLPDVPQDYSFDWQLTNGGRFIDYEIKRQSSDQTTIRIYGGGYIYRNLSLRITSPAGCVREYNQDISIVEPIAPPVLSLVYPNGSKNAIAWDTENLSAEITEIIIYKETSVQNKFVEIGRASVSDGTFTDPSSNNNVRSDRYVISGVTDLGVETAKSDIHKTMHLTINRGVQDGTWNLIWNKYEGRNIATYRILQGSSPDNLTTVLDEISGANTSFTQFDNPDAPYYAVEYIPSSTQLRSSALRSGDVFLGGGAPSSGRTNVVNSTQAATIIYTSRLNILTLANNIVLSEEQPSMYLHAEIFPSNTTYQNVEWSIVSGSEYASINNSGHLQATSNTQGGTVTVKALAMDGSEIFATQTFTVEAFTAAAIIPVASDFVVANLNQLAGNVTEVTVTPNSGKSQGGITVYYNGSTSIPQAAGSYTITFDVAEDEQNNFASATELTGGTLVVSSSVVPVTSVELNIHSQNLQVGDQLQLTATVLPANATNQNLTWSSSNTSVAAVVNGLVTALSAGETTITVTTEDGGKTATCNVTVEEATDINEVKRVDIQLYPNPVADVLYIQTEETITNLRLLTISGVLMIEENEVFDKIDISNLPQGVYILTLRSAEGNLWQERIIKK